MTQASLSRRLGSIDAFRAVTMLLMIFVNDLVSLTDIPRWLEHAGETESRMGLADVVFPAFLFIVGLSIPSAIRSRRAKGLSDLSTLWHILVRSLALLVMGFFQVNYEEYTRGIAAMDRYWWLLWATLAFFGVWMDYPKDMPLRFKNLLRCLSLVLLVVLALLYRGGTPQDPMGMRPHWYGILGLIGWCYLICALLYLWIGERIEVLIIIMGVFLAICVIDRSNGLHFFDPLRQFIWIVGSGSLPAITMGGIIAAIIYRKGTEGGTAQRSLYVLLGFGLVMLAGGLVFKPFWGISKIRSTPSWIMISLAISLGVFVLIAYFTDIRGHEGWYSIIKPAGTSTLTCYLLPYIHFAINHLLGEAYRIPPVLRTGGIGIVKSMLYAFVIVWITGWLEKKRVRLSI